MITLLVALVSSSQLFAQKQALKQIDDQQFILQRKANTDFTKVALSPHYQVTDIVHYLKKQVPNCQSVHTQLQLLRQQKSPIGVHYMFQQLLEDIPIYQAQIQVSVNRKNEIISVIENTYNIEKVNLSIVKQKNNLLKSQQVVIKQQFLQQRQLLQSQSNASIVVLFDSPTTAQLALQIEAYSQNGQIFAEYLVNEEGKVLFEKDQNRYYKGEKCCHKEGKHAHAKQMVNATAYVFNPDPITSAKAAYGLNGGFRDNEDEDSPELNAERQTVTIEVSVEDGLYILENPYVRIASLPVFLDGSPIIPVAVSTTPIFDFTRSQSGFEDVNAYYHINEFRTYINSLTFKGEGFTDLTSHFIEVDTHGANGEDNSQYRFQNSRHYLVFGEGNVDDAEDADVIVHEYCHSMSQQACTNCNFGFERGALDEALCDYFATSYSRAITEFNWQNMFSWDGHNPFFAGRNMNSDKTYPDDINEGSIHLTGEIWSGALMDIWEYLGRETTDMLMLTAMYFLGPNVDLPAAAELMLMVDREFCAGENQEILRFIFGKRGLIDANEFINSGSENVYTLQISDQGIFIGTANTLTISLPMGTQEMNLTIYDVAGRLVTDNVYLTDAPIHFNNRRLAAGLYIIRAIIDGRVITFKFSKAE